jgi:hypothetical protein
MGKKEILLTWIASKKVSTVPHGPSPFALGPSPFALCPSPFALRPTCVSYVGTVLYS